MKDNLAQLQKGAKDQGYSDLLSTNLSPEKAQEAVDTAAQITGDNGVIGRIDQQIKELRNQMTDVMNNSDISPDTKEILRRQLMESIVKLEEEGLQYLNAYRDDYMTGSNYFTYVFNGGTEAKQANPYTGQTIIFQEDVKNKESYIEKSLERYNALMKAGKPSSTPLLTPNASVAVGKKNYNVKYLTMPDGSPAMDAYSKVFRDAVKEYMDAEGDVWDSLTDEEKDKLLSKAKSTGNKRAKEWLEDNFDFDVEED
jgi:hypothetical protein